MSNVTSPVVDGKAAWQSFTNWLNAGGLLFLVLFLNDPQVQALIPPAALPWIAAGVMGVNLYLRNFKTSQPIVSVL